MGPVEAGLVASGARIAADAREGGDFTTDLLVLSLFARPFGGYFRCVTPSPRSAAKQYRNPLCGHPVLGLLESSM